MMKYIGIVGSRTRDSIYDFIKLHGVFEEVYSEGDILVSGGCPKGGDAMAECIAWSLDGNPIIIFEANWDKYGKSAGFIRNKPIAVRSDVLIALIANNRKGGTEDTIRKFREDKPNGKLWLL